MCFDTALWEHPTSFAISFWGLYLRVEVVNDDFLHICPGGSLPNECEFYWTKLRDHLKAQEPFAGVSD
jgi:hypothetical protein